MMALSLSVVVVVAADGMKSWKTQQNKRQSRKLCHPNRYRKYWWEYAEEESGKRDPCLNVYFLLELLLEITEYVIKFSARDCRPEAPVKRQDYVGNLEPGCGESSLEGSQPSTQWQKRENSERR